LTIDAQPIYAVAGFADVPSADLTINVRFDEYCLSKHSIEELLSEIHTSLVGLLSEFLSYF
jgi:hypothetical protein